MKKLLYLHGLNSTLHLDRRKVLEQYTIEILAPSLDYEGDPEVWNYIIRTYDVDAIIGSSAGGLAGFYFSGLKKIPALLFNPALPFRHYLKAIPTLPERQAYLQVVLGAKDEEVPALQTFEFLRGDLAKNAPMELHWIHQMGHPLPIDIFEREVNFFMRRIGVKQIKNPED